MAAREHKLKSEAQRVERDVRLSQLFTELMQTANGRGPVEVGEATQAAAIATIGSLGVEHETLRTPALHALRALEFADGRPALARAREEALDAVRAAL